MASFCTAYGLFSPAHMIWLSLLFLLAALGLAVGTGLLSIWEKVVMLRKIRDATHEQVRQLTGVDSGLLQALSGVIDSLVKAPAWFARCQNRPSKLPTQHHPRMPNPKSRQQRPYREPRICHEPRIPKLATTRRRHRRRR